MGLKEALEGILNLGKSGRRPSQPPASVVLLLREQRFPNLEELRQAAEKAFGVTFSLEKSSRHSVYVQVLFTLMNIGRHTVSFMFYTKPYGDDSQKLGQAWRLPSQRSAWAAHTAWIAVDYVKGGIDFESRYALLARLCRELYDANCSGVYLPREKAFVPDEVPAREMLDRAIASRQIDVT
jgi:hypothetical protein